MTIKRALSFVINTAISLTMILLLVYFIMNFTDFFFNMGRDLADDLTGELPDRVITLSVPQDSTISDIAALLEDEGIIRSALFFRLESILKGNRQIFDENQVTVSTDMSYNQLIFAFLERHIIAENIIVTIPEGATVDDIAAYLEYRGLVLAEEFVRASNESVFNFPFLRYLPDVSERYNRLEGYLFPDTYFIPENATAEAIIHQMLSRFQEIYSIYAAEAYEKGLTMDEVIIIASIIEREIRVPRERELASQVIHNRLAIGQRLEMCSTVLYALGESRRRLLYVDLLTVSDYNTYMHGGLPIGPIANPGVACIRAALRPSEGDLLFFVLMDENTGEHYFANNYADFLAARARYLD
ncbi:MAG: endolytic transglycosylase MltG [Defluviitaleaceae bacterium]|nr:endolytic transglycosylase MltG [Defluviitaleaceae bacterium]